ncbi:MAG: MBL fold metallo-hydrolase [Alphaproteobacteria bacterium]|nr:MBL fold metallo-hydrolase [Alphaproteobacteria bacterium]
MRATLLGTGGSAGVPMIGGVDGHGDWGACDPAEPRNRRTRSSMLIQQHGATLLVDTPPDMRAQLLAAGVARVDAVLFTHAHADHITGLDDVRILNRIIDRPLDALATHATLDELARRFDYAFRPWQPPGFFRPVLAPRIVAPGDTVRAAGIEVRFFDQDHGFTRSLGLRVGRLGYSTDAVALDDAAFAALAGVDTWIVGCFQREPHHTHAWLARVLGWAARVAARRTVLTHMGTDLDWAWLRANLPPGIEPGFDGQVLEVPD